MKKFDFNLKDVLNPHDLIEIKLEEIERATKGYVKGVILPYDGEIESYTRRRGILNLSYELSEEKEVDIQDDLGELDSTKNRYEVYIIGKNLNNYKYRIMFVDYGSVSYPVTIVMNKDLSLEYSGQYKSNFKVNSMDELESMIDKVINNEILTDLYQNLIYECIRQENVETNNE